MAEAHHATEKDRGNCEVVGCSEKAERSIGAKRVEKAGLDLLDSVRKRAYLCKAHYREFKKKTKKDRQLDSLGW